MRAQSTHYLDLRNGDVLKIPPSNLELEVSKVSIAGLLVVMRYGNNDNTSIIPLRRRQYIAFHDSPRSVRYRTEKIGGIYNFGNRAHGKRNHVRIELMEGYSFSHLKARRKMAEKIG